MNCTIEIIDGVPYVLRRVSNTKFPCENCVLDNTSKCPKAHCKEQDGFNTNYRYLTSVERESLINLIKRGAVI